MASLAVKLYGPWGFRAAEGARVTSYDDDYIDVDVRWTEQQARRQGFKRGALWTLAVVAIVVAAAVVGGILTHHIR
jgi:hypothetical protein